MSASQHVSTPYIVKVGTSRFYIHGNNGRAKIASISNELTHQEDTANFIVRACNSHEALVEALKGFFSFNDGTAEWDAAIDKANAALRLAKP